MVRYRVPTFKSYLKGTIPMTRKSKNTRGMKLEQLENRELLAADIMLSGDMLIVDGHEKYDDVIQIEEVRSYGKQGPGYEISVMDAKGNVRKNDQGQSLNIFVKQEDVRSLVVRGHGGDDKIVNHSKLSMRAYGGDGNDSISGGTGNDVLAGQNGNDVIYGQAGNDRILGGSGNDRLYGFHGNDSINGGSGDDRLYGQEGNDRLYGANGNDWLYGGNGDDVLSGNAGGDRMRGDDGNDRIYGGSGVDIAQGGNGADRLIGQSGNDVLIGQAGNDFLFGNDGNDRMFGGDGDDRLFGHDGNDRLDGGNGNDRLSGMNGDDHLLGKDGSDRLYGGNDNDFLEGGDQSDILQGNGGNDTLYGQGGGDLINGGTGNDGLFGGAGQDVMSGSSGADRFLAMDNETWTGTDIVDWMDDVSSEDAVISFGNAAAVNDITFGSLGESFDFAAGDFTEEEIELVDAALADLHRKTNNTTLLKTASGGQISFLRQGSQTSDNSFQVGGWNNGVDIVLTDRTFSSDDRVYRVSIHEIAHNWEDENPGWDAWKAISGWTTEDKSGDPNYTQGLNASQTWYHLADAGFAREYGRTNPKEDFATSMAAYFVAESGRTYEFGPAQGGTESGAAAIPEKLEFLDDFFAGLTTV